MEEIRNDEDVLSDVTESLAWDSRINDGGINIVVHDGMVLLSGQVVSHGERLIASEDAWRVKGVRQIENNILVIPGEVRDDAQIATELETLLNNDVRVRHEEVKLTVSGGVVYLEGLVRGAHQRLAAEEDAWFTTGVVGVVNGIELRPSHQRTDEEILRDVQAKIERDATMADPTAIVVKCRHGVVTLQGHVQSRAEAEVAESEAGFVLGVKQVVNRLTIRTAA